MSTDQGKAARFRALHRPGDPLVLFNIWDAGGARLVQAAGAAAVATGSWSVAASLGLGDGEQVSLELVLENLRRIVAATKMPVTADFEAGYGATAAEVGRSVGLAVGTGVVGLNIEDGLSGGGLRDPADQAERLRAAREAAGDTFLNARIDVFLQAPPDAHANLLGAAVDRAGVYGEAGADGIFAPGLADETLIRSFCAAVDRPVNIMHMPGAPGRRALAEAGVARISHGPGPYRLMAETLTQAARAAMTS